MAGMMAGIPVQHHGRLDYIDFATCQYWLPQLHAMVLHDGHEIDVADLANQVVHDYAVNYGAAQRTIVSLLACLRMQDNHFHYFDNFHQPQQRIRNRLNFMLGGHLPRAHGYMLNLHHSRETFHALCAIAAMTESQPLVQVLVDFFQQYAYEIVHVEHPRLLLEEWALGLRHIQQFIPHEMYIELMALLAQRGDRMQAAWRHRGIHNPVVEDLLQMILNQLQRGAPWGHDRGYRPIRHFMDHRPRAIGALPLRRHRSLPRMAIMPMPQNMLLHQRYARPLLGGNVMDDIDMLKMRQDVLEHEVDHLKIDVGRPPMLGLDWY